MEMRVHGGKMKDMMMRRDGLDAYAVFYACLCILPRDRTSINHYRKLASVK